MSRSRPALSALVLLTLFTFCLRSAADQFVLPGFFEFRMAGDWKKGEVRKATIGPVEFHQATAEWKEKKALLYFASAQIPDPSKVKDPSRITLDAKGMAKLMMDSVKPPEGGALKKSKPIITKLEEAGPAELMFRLQYDDASMSGISLAARKGAYAIVLFEEGPTRDRTAFWKAVGNSLKTK